MSRVLNSKKLFNVLVKSTQIENGTINKYISNTYNIIY